MTSAVMMNIPCLLTMGQSCHSLSPLFFCETGMALPPRLTEQLSYRYTQRNHPFPSLWRKETAVLIRKSGKSSNLLEGRIQVAVAGQETLIGFNGPWARPDSLCHLS